MVMKKLISVLLTISIAVAALAQPQGRPRQKGQMPDFEKMKAERVAFITSEVGLTSEDAQAFWPIYNKVEEKQRELNKAEKTAFMELSKALKDGDGNVDALLDAYIKAKQANVNLHFANAKEYKKAIGAEKTAKFFTLRRKVPQAADRQAQRRPRRSQGGLPWRTQGRFQGCSQGRRLQGMQRLQGWQPAEEQVTVRCSFDPESPGCEVRAFIV